MARCRPRSMLTVRQGVRRRDLILQDLEAAVSKEPSMPPTVSKRDARTHHRRSWLSCIRGTVLVALGLTAMASGAMAIAAPAITQETISIRHIGQAANGVQIVT